MCVCELRFLGNFIRFFFFLVNSITSILEILTKINLVRKHC